MSTRRLGIKTLVLAAMLCGLLALPALADSQARIVRLSDVEGTVEIDRNTGQGFETAFLNLPITEGAKLKAKDDGRAEVEFEDGSVLRIVPNTMVTFTQLSLRDSGGKVSTIHLREGTAYINFQGKKDDQFTVNFARESTTLTHPAHFRVDLNDTDATLAVFKGEVDVQGPAGSVEVASKHSATFDLVENDEYTLAKNYAEDPYDHWDKQQAQYHERYLSSNTYDASYYPYSYGVSDLNYYGNYCNVPGYGWMWQPYFTGIGWSPFSNGAWVWYPGFGYTWVSSYPWGWMPYRYGTWGFVPGYGWGWFPGGWNTWYTVPRVTNPPNRFATPQPPAGNGHQTVIVGKGPAGPAAPPRRMVINQGSAGLDIPRGSISNLPKVSQRVTAQGVATVRTAPAMRTSSSMPGFYTPRMSGGMGRMGSISSGSRGSVSHSSSGSRH